MKKRILSLILTFLMVFGLAACGKANKVSTAYDFANKIGEMELYSSDTQFDVTGGAEDISIKVRVANSDVNEGSFVVEAKAGDMSDYETVTTVYVTKDMELYINARQILDFMTSYDSQFAMVSSFIALNEDYISISKDELVQLYEEMGEDSAELEEQFEGLYSADASKAYLSLFGDFFDQIKANTGDSVVSISSDKLTITVNNDNVDAFADALSKISYKEYLEDEKNKAKFENYDQLEESVETIDEGLKQAAAELKEFAKNAKIDAKFEWIIAGKNVNATFDANIEADGEVINVKMTSKSTPDKNTDFTKPEKSVGFIEFLEQLGMK